MAEAVPQISVVLRTHRRTELMQRAARSVLAQTFTDLELLIVDDCSGDETRDVVAALADQDDRVRYLETPEPLVLGGRTLNFGIEHARGRLLTFLDDDDWWEPEKLEVQYGLLTPGVGLVTCGVRRIDSSSGEEASRWVPEREGSVYWESLGQSGEIFGPPSAVLIPRAVLDEVGLFREDMPRGACQELFRRIARDHQLACAPSLLLNYLVHSNSITSMNSVVDFQKDVDSRRIKLQSIESDIAQLPETYGNELRQIAVSALCSGDRDSLLFALERIEEAGLVVRSAALLRLAAANPAVFGVLSPLGRQVLMARRRRHRLSAAGG